jgi:hypothetical protein
MYRVESFERVGDYKLRISFNDGTTRVIDFEAILAVGYSVRCATRRFLRKLNLTLKFTRLFGLPALISIRRLSMIGPNTSPHLKPQQNVGLKIMSSPNAPATCHAVAFWRRRIMGDPFETYNDEVDKFLAKPRPLNHEDHE